MTASRGVSRAFAAPPGLRGGLGVDGCRGGWVAISLGPGQSWGLGVYPTFACCVAAHDRALILVDMPIGLPGTQRRAVEACARALLGRARSSSVFPVPARSALGARSYPEAQRINRSHLGTGIPIQSWNLAGKIREVDACLRAEPALTARIREAHPELAFWGLGGGRSMSHSKRTALGRRERLTLLRSLCALTDEIYSAALARYRRAEVAHDDVLDALALAVAAHTCRRSLRTIPARPCADEYGLPMHMLVPFRSSGGDRSAD